MKKPPTIAIDFRWLDHLSLGNGQFRYAVDLVNGLAEAESELRFVVLGSKPEPIAEIAGVFADEQKWRYAGVPRLAGKGSLYREHSQYFRLLRKLSTTPFKPKEGFNGAPVRIDLLHALHSFVPLYPPVPVVETVYDMMLELFPEYAEAVRSREYRMHKWAFRRFIRRAIVISKTTALDLERLWLFPAERVDVVYLGPRLPVTAGETDRKGPAVILAPYNLEPRKNLSRLLQATAKLKTGGVKFRLVLFGRAAVNDERERQFREELSRLDLDSSTELTGRVSDEELVNLYRTCSVFVFPSLYEGFGLPVLEAMSVGARVVAHHASAMAEVVGDAGYLVDMTDVSEIARAIAKAMNDATVGEQAASRAREFSRERMARETVAVYRKVLSR